MSDLETRDVNITISGPPGVGKTTVAAMVYEALAAYLPNAAIQIAVTDGKGAQSMEKFIRSPDALMRSLRDPLTDRPAVDLTPLRVNLKVQATPARKAATKTVTQEVRVEPAVEHVTINPADFPEAQEALAKPDFGLDNPDWPADAEREPLTANG